jgi:hypothetical protein
MFVINCSCFSLRYVRKNVCLVRYDEPTKGDTFYNLKHENYLGITVNENEHVARLNTPRKLTSKQ